MAWCEQCGAKLTKAARFCPACGRRVGAAEAEDPTPEPLGADAARPLLPQTLPDWARTDWAVAAVAALIVLGICLAAGVVYGAIDGWAVTGRAGGIVSGILTGAYLPFAMFGVETVVFRYAGDSTFGFDLKTLPVPLVLVVVAAMYAALRFAWPRINRAPAHLFAFVAKVALVVGAITSVLAALLSTGAVRADGAVEDAFVARVPASTAFLYPVLLVALIGVALMLVRRATGGRRLEAFVDSDSGAAVVGGALAFLAVAFVLALVVLGADVGSAEDGNHKAGALVAFFATGINRGIAATAFAMGGAVERFVGHTSLFDWGSYDRPGPSTAPAPLFAWLGLAPAAVAYFTLRTLDRFRPADEQGVVRIAAGTVVGFVATSTILVVVTAQDRVAAASPRAGFGLALLWALVAASGAAVLWARSHGVRWRSLDADGSTVNPWARDKRRQPTEILDPPPVDDQPPTPSADAAPTLVDERDRDTET